MLEYGTRCLRRWYVGVNWITMAREGFTTPCCIRDLPCYCLPLLHAGLWPPVLQQPPCHHVSHSCHLHLAACCYSKGIGLKINENKSDTVRHWRMLRWSQKKTISGKTFRRSASSSVCQWKQVRQNLSLKINQCKTSFCWKRAIEVPVNRKSRSVKATAAPTTWSMWLPSRRVH